MTKPSSTHAAPAPFDMGRLLGRVREEVFEKSRGPRDEMTGPDLLFAVYEICVAEGIPAGFSHCQGYYTNATGHYAHAANDEYVITLDNLMYDYGGVVSKKAIEKSCRGEPGAKNLRFVVDWKTGDEVNEGVLDEVPRFIQAICRECVREEKTRAAVDILHAATPTASGRRKKPRL